ncbi:MAG TPA: response regulator [Micropepsaceae bacterium]|nr:response regulator [Micropepsaceae bacterium]
MEYRAQRKVYVIDDDDAVRDSMRAVLESFEIDVSDYPSASDFLARVNAPANGCMLLDLHMPGISGLELVEIMRKRGWSLPVIAMTGRSDDLLKERLLRAGVEALLDKPVDETTLTHALDRAFARSATARCTDSRANGKPFSFVQPDPKTGERRVQTAGEETKP